MSKPKVPYWYLTDGSLGFLGIVQSSDDPGDSGTSSHGPFERLSDCKRHAIERFRFDIDTCREAISEIRAAKPERQDT